MYANYKKENDATFKQLIFKLLDLLFKLRFTYEFCLLLKNDDNLYKYNPFSGIIYLKGKYIRSRACPNKKFHFILKLLKV